jgi:SAM-dependent methyltransferase
MSANRDEKVIDGFGDEWSRFNQEKLVDEELTSLFDDYFAIFPWEHLSKEAIGADFGCGSGRWAKLVAPKVGKLFCVDPSSKALSVATRSLASLDNVVLLEDDVDTKQIEPNSLDFAYSLGVLHHIPDTQRAMNACVSKLKAGAPFLVYLYYAFDNRSRSFKLLWKASDILRQGISRTPHGLRYLLSQLFAIGVYWPLARFARMIEKTGRNVDAYPLSVYRNRSFYVMRTDALDRFGTRLEKRFTKKEISEMMINCGLRDITFHTSAPYWCAIGYKN